MNLLMNVIQICERQRRRGGRLLALTAGLCILVLAPAALLHAQVDTGIVLGTVTDSSGAAISNATVSLRNEETGLVLKQNTKTDGSYLFNAVKVGSYSVTVSAAGFEAETVEHLTVAIQQKLVENLSLQPGKTSSTVTVVAENAVLQTQDASVGQVVSEHMIDNLPLNGRNYTLLAQLAPGTTTTVYDSGHGELQSGTFTANGVTTTYNNYLLDGITNNNMTADFGNGNSFTLLPPPDGLAEFKVETGDYSAEYGRSGGAIINAVTHSGQNTLFGDLWYFNRNRFFDSNDYFLKRAGQPRPKFNRNQFGFSLGGPVMLPHFNGRDRFLFFVDYNGETVRQGQAYTSSVPTLAERNSNFTNFSDLYGSQNGTQTDILGRTTPLGQIFDPATTRYLSAGTTDPVTGYTALYTGYVREPFAGNIIPQQRVSPVSAALLALFPAPNTNLTATNKTVNNYVSAPVNQITNNTFDARTDENISPKDQLFERGSFGYIPRVIPDPCPTAANCGVSATNGSEYDVILGVAIGETHTFSSSLLNELRIGYNRIHRNIVGDFGDQLNLNQQYGIPGIPSNDGNGGLAQIRVTGLSELGEHNNNPEYEVGSESAYMDNVSLQRGPHNLRFGVDYERIKNALLSAQFPHGYFSFTGGYSDQPTVLNSAHTGTVGGNTANTGIAQFVVEPTVTSVPNCTVITQASGSGTGCQTYNYVGGASQIQASPMSQQDYRHPYFGAYIQDDWRILPRLTINAGLRWEYFEDGIDHAGHAANFVPGFANHGQAMYLIDDRVKNVPLSPSFVSLLQQENIALVYTSNHQLRHLNENNFAPRLGFAWQFFNKSVLRGGYAISYAGIYARGDGYNPGDNYPFSFSVNITSSNQGGLASDSGNKIGPMDQGLAAIPLTPTQAQGYQISPRGNQYNFRVPYVQSMNLTLQQQIFNDQFLEIAYVGTFNRHIESLIDSNRVDMMIPTTFSVSPVTPSPTCNDSGLYHDVDPNNPNPTAQDNKVYYDQYPCLAQANYYMWNEGSNNYNSMQVTYRKMNTNGTSLIADYTWSKFLGYGSDSNLFNSESYRGPFIPGFGMKGEYGPEDFASTNVVHIGGIWQLPFGLERRWLHDNRLLDTLIGGWNLSGIFTYQSGQPVNVSCNLSHAAGVGCYSIANRLQMFTNAHTLTHWLNAAAYSEPTTNTTTPNVTDFSPMGARPGNGYGPAFHRADMSIQKNFILPFERRNVVEFRAESFNITNTPNFGQPGSLTPSNSAFASITSERDSPNDSREFQFSLRYIFGRGGQE
jgi:hypothetical protein